MADNVSFKIGIHKTSKHGTVWNGGQKTFCTMC